ncbi:thymidylate synthase [Vibrio phage vB_VibM_10AMN]|uniref:Thymidylate synthase n=1 Tax=Staphylococcus phage vB_VibM_10AMN12 TaxID=3076785 RepID=A0AA96KSQ7_9CAUD|nr:thymidylate synthase [Vibrio phage vB_VibM_10AMN]WNO47554.1 thymidylate synthase [Staphylococcus phage vB_VibM_10AMN12]
MEGIKIELVDVMGNDSSVSNSARVSFNKWKEEFDEQDEKLIKYLAKHRHMTPFRHTQVQIRCKAPIFLVRQLGKHQAGLSWNEVSRRYVKTEPEFFIPKEWRSVPDGSIKQGSGDEVVTHLRDEENVRTISVDSAYQDYVEGAVDLYSKMLEDGVAPEMARMILPQSMQTEWVWSGNILAFAHVYKERIASGAQLEAQDFAKKLDEVIRPIFPVAWSALVD